MHTAVFTIYASNTTPAGVDALLLLRRLSDASSRRKKETEIGRRVDRATADVQHQLQGQNVKGQGHQAT